MIMEEDQCKAEPRLSRRKGAPKSANTRQPKPRASVVGEYYHFLDENGVLPAKLWPDGVGVWDYIGFTTLPQPFLPGSCWSEFIVFSETFTVQEAGLLRRPGSLPAGACRPLSVKFGPAGKCAAVLAALALSGHIQRLEYDDEEQGDGQTRQETTAVTVVIPRLCKM